MATRSGKTAVITGASAGIGRELAHLFARDGHDVVLVARRLDRLEELAAELHAEHEIEAHPLAVDLADPEAPNAIREFTTRNRHSVEFLVNNAGFGSNGPFVDLDLKSELAMIQVNISALVHLTHLFLPDMVERGHGRILNMGSTAGFQGGPYMATYYASKSFVNLFTEALWFELEDSGVTATVYCPGPVATEFSEVAGNDRSKLFKGGTVASPGEVAERAYQAMAAGKRLVVHSLKYKLLLQTQRLGSRGMVLGFAKRLNKP